MDWHKRFLQQAGWTHDLRLYLFGQAGLSRAERVLEVGCGTGAILMDLPTPAFIHGLDLDRGRLTEAHLHVPAALLTCGDAHCLPYLSRCFDIVFFHFLLLWVSNPLGTLIEMIRVCRPGGSILALAEPDYSARVDKPDTLSPLGRWQTEALRRQGAYPDMGKRLAGLFRQAGIQIIETGTLGDGAGSATGKASNEYLPTREEQELEWAVLEADISRIISKEEIQQMKLLDRQAWESGERQLKVPTYFAWGRV